MLTKERITLFATACALLWLGLMIAPAIASADELEQVDHPTIDYLFVTDNAGDERRRTSTMRC